jgi:DNA adenine methylase
MQNNNHILPFLRWAGGKRWLSKQIAPILKRRLNGRYFEPFLGAGAMFFAISPENALLSDLNHELINVFKIVGERPNRLINEIQKIPVDNKTYYKIRSSKPQSNFKKAVRFIYLNRTCYGGLYRENLKGEFNTPYGGGSRTPEPLWGQNLIANASKLLSKKSIKLEVNDFEVSIKKANKGDVIYCDPTYSAVTRNQFDRYGSIIFNWKDQERLADQAIQALDRGVLVIISNAYCEEIRTLYQDSIIIQQKKVKAIGNKTKSDNTHKEYLIILDPQRNYQDWVEIGEVETYN